MSLIQKVVGVSFGNSTLLIPRLSREQIIQVQQTLLVVLSPAEYLSHGIGEPLHAFLFELYSLFHFFSQKEELFLDESLHEVVIHVVSFFFS